MRFTPNDFQHNARVGAALLPCLAVLAGFGGKLPAAVLLVRRAQCMVACIQKACSTPADAVMAAEHAVFAGGHLHCCMTALHRPARPCMHASMPALSHSLCTHLVTQAMLAERQGAAGRWAP